MRWTCEDAIWTTRLAEFYEEGLSDEELTEVYWRMEEPLVHILADPNLHGYHHGIGSLFRCSCIDQILQSTCWKGEGLHSEQKNEKEIFQTEEEITMIETIGLFLIFLITESMFLLILDTFRISFSL